MKIDWNNVTESHQSTIAEKLLNSIQTNAMEYLWYLGFRTIM